MACVYVCGYICHEQDKSIFGHGFMFVLEMAQGVSLSLYIGIGAKFENTQKTGERRLRTAEYRTVLL